MYKTTYFIRCKASDKILDIKEKLQELVDKPAKDQRLILPGTGEVLDDSKTLADQKVHYYINFHVIYYVYISFLKC
jgi:elongin-B